jgi:hypothetical protein
MIYEPLEHYSYPQLDVECSCNLCTDWRQHRDLFDEMKRLTWTHNRSCMCWRCRKRREYQNKFIAAASRRELYCEMSFHASRHPSYGPRLMAWVSRELAENTETNGWWSTLGQAYSLTFWFSKFQESICPESRIHPTVKIVEKPLPQTWCGWCGEDLPMGKVGYCNEDCYTDYVAHRIATERKPERRRLIESVNGWIQAVSGCASTAVSGIAA